MVQVHHPKIVDTFVNPPRVMPAAPKQENVFMGRVGLYRDFTVFEFPPEVTRRIDAWGEQGMKVSSSGADTWEIKPRPSHRLARGGRIAHPRHMGQISSELKGTRIVNAVLPATMFGMSPAKFTLTDGYFVVTVAEADKVPFAGRAPRTPKSKDIIEKLSGEDLSGIELIPIAEAMAPARKDLFKVSPVAVVDSRQNAEHDMRDLLSRLREIEAATPYRLRREKDTGLWVFSAPVIK